LIAARTSRALEGSLEARLVRRAGDSAIVSITLARGFMLRKIFVVALLLRRFYALLMLSVPGDAGLKSLVSLRYLAERHEFAARSPPARREQTKYFIVCGRAILYSMPIGN
jgi:hypothetical protein